MGPFEKGTEPAFKGSTLQYLLHDRRPVWGTRDHGTALGGTIQSAATAQDPESTRLAFKVAKILAADTRKNFGVSDSQHLEIKDSKGLDALSGVRPAMAEILASHITQVNASFRAAALGLPSAGTPLSDSEPDYLLLYVTRDADAFTTLLNAQLAHAKLAVDGAVASRSPHLDNVIVGEGWMFGHLLEIRNQNIAAEGGRITGVNEALRNQVETGAAFIPTGENRVGQVPVLGKAYSMIHHGVYPRGDLKGQNFLVEGTDAKIKPLREMTPRQLDAFIRWADDNTDINVTRNDMLSAIENGAREASGHFRGDGGINVRPTFQR